MSPSELRTVARLLREALAYESREVRIGRIVNSPYLDVQMLAKRLQTEGYLNDHQVHDPMVLPNYTPPRGHNR